MTRTFAHNRFPAMVAGLLIFWSTRHGVSAREGDLLRGGAAGDYVILLHGMGRTAISMKGMEWHLKAQGYRVINASYRSTRLSIPELADGFLAQLLQERIQDADARVHFVTHSLGGIILRQYLATHRMEQLGRVVMLAPPNQGSPVADKLQQIPFYRFFTGPSGQQLGTGAESIPRRLGPADFDLGVIAGDRSMNPLFSAWIPGASDGKVPVEYTHLDGMRDFLVVHHTHTWLAWSKNVITATSHFLKSGRFQ